MFGKCKWCNKEERLERKVYKDCYISKTGWFCEECRTRMDVSKLTEEDEENENSV